MIAYKSYKKQRRYNLTDIEIKIIDDENKLDYYWYVNYRFNNCQKTIDKINIVVMKPFMIYNIWHSESLKICPKEVNALELSNIFDEDYVLLCLKIEKQQSEIYMKKIEKNLKPNSNIKIDSEFLTSIIKVDTEFVRLNTRSFNYSQLHYA